MPKIAYMYYFITLCMANQQRLHRLISKSEDITDKTKVSSLTYTAEFYLESTTGSAIPRYKVSSKKKTLKLFRKILATKRIKAELHQKIREAINDMIGLNNLTEIRLVYQDYYGAKKEAQIPTALLTKETRSELSAILKAKGILY